MKKVLLAFFYLAILVSCQSAIAQPKPSISSKYSDDKIKELLSSYQIAHSRDIAPSVNLRTKFESDFPNARDIDWEFAVDVYEVEFEIGRVDYKCYYTKDGDLIMYVFDITGVELPAVVKNATIAKYPDYDFEDIKEIRRGTEVLYDIDLQHHNVEVEMLVNINGTILNEKFD